MNSFRKIFYVIILVAALPIQAQQHPVSFGPVTMGKALPALPDCPLDKYNMPVDGKEPCLWRTHEPWTETPELYAVNVVPHSTLKIDIEACGAQDRWFCPVGQITADVPEVFDGTLVCRSVLARLTTKFGGPVHRAIPLQNGFGAHWTEHDYIWTFASGDRVGYGTNMEVGGGNCYLSASTRAFRAVSDLYPKPGPKAKF